MAAECTVCGCTSFLDPSRVRRELGFVHEPLDASLGEIVARFLAHPPPDRPDGYASREAERAAAAPGAGPTA